MAKSKRFREAVQTLDAGTSVFQKLAQAADWILQQAVGTQPGAIVTVAVVIAGVIWAWLKDTPWYVALPAICIALGGSTALIYYFRRIRELPKHVADREQLADDLEQLSRDIAALVGEYRGPLQESWWKEVAKSAGGPASTFAQQGVIEGKLVERYSLRYATDAWIYGCLWR